MPPVSVRTVAAADSRRAIAVIAIAFGADPVARWSYPDPHEYLAHFPELAMAFAGAAFAHATADYADDFSGAALWLPPGVTADEERMGAIIEQSIPEPKRGEVFALLEKMDHFHPAEPHWHLPLIGVDPLRQGMGCGDALMRHALVRCDRDKSIAILESTNPRNMSLYRRHGFEPLGTIHAGSSPPVVPMMRRPQ